MRIHKAFIFQLLALLSLLSCSHVVNSEADHILQFIKENRSIVLSYSKYEFYFSTIRNTCGIIEIPTFSNTHYTKKIHLAVVVSNIFSSDISKMKIISAVIRRNGPDLNVEPALVYSDVTNYLKLIVKYNIWAIADTENTIEFKFSYFDNDDIILYYYKNEIVANNSIQTNGFFPIDKLPILWQFKHWIYNNNIIYCFDFSGKLISKRK